MGKATDHNSKAALVAPGSDDFNNRGDGFCDAHGLNTSQDIFKEGSALTGIEIYICGPLELQNNLIGSYLTQQTGAAFYEYNSCETVLENLECKGDKTILMLDAQVSGIDEFIDNVNLKFAGKNISIVLFNIMRDSSIRRWIKRGVKGVFFSDDQPHLIAKGIQKLYEGEYWYSKAALQQCVLEQLRPAPSGDEEMLTNREAEILQLISQGYGNDEIADALCISFHTVKTHLTSIYRKINVSNRVQAVLWYIDHNEG